MFTSKLEQHPLNVKQAPLFKYRQNQSKILCHIYTLTVYSCCVLFAHITSFILQLKGSIKKAFTGQLR